MSTYISPMYYAVFCSLIINVLSSYSSAWHLESSHLDFIQTSTLYPLCSIGQIVALTLHISFVVLVSFLANRSLYIQPVSLSGNRLLNNWPASGHLSLTRDTTLLLYVLNSNIHWRLLVLILLTIQRLTVLRSMVELIPGACLGP
jgi:hypothetical protein